MGRYCSERETDWEMLAGTMMETCQIYHTHTHMLKGIQLLSHSTHTHICLNFPQKRTGKMSHKTQLDEFKMFKTTKYVQKILSIHE